MKRAYMKPAMRGFEISHSLIICNSKWDVMGPGQPNQAAGSRRFDGWEYEDE